MHAESRFPRRTRLSRLIANTLALLAVLAAIAMCWHRLGAGVSPVDAAPLGLPMAAPFLIGNLRTLRQRRETIRKAALKRSDEISGATAKDNRLMSEEEKAELDGFKAQIADCDAQIQAAELLQEEERRTVPVPTGEDAAGGTEPTASDAEPSRMMRQREVEGMIAAARVLPVGSAGFRAATKAVARRTAARPVVSVVLAEEDRPWSRAGEFFQAVARQARSNGADYDPRLKRSDPKYNRQAASPAGGSEGDPAAGGFLVQEDFSDELLDKAIMASEVLSRAREIEITSPSNRLVMPIWDETSRVTGSRWGGIRVFRLAEANAATIEIGKFARLEIVAERMDGLCAMTDELLEDVPALEGFIDKAFTSEFSWMADDEIINGNGIGRCLGLLNAPATITVAKESGQATGTIVAQNVMKMWARLWAPSRKNAVWFINQEVETQLMQLSIAVGTGGLPLWIPANGLSGEPYSTFMGRPVIPIEQCDALGSVGDIILADLDQYMIARKGALKRDTSMHVYFVTHQTAFRFSTRFNGQPAWKSALTPARGTASLTLGPYVTLAARP